MTIAVCFKNDPTIANPKEVDDRYKKNAAKKMPLGLVASRFITKIVNPINTETTPMTVLDPIKLENFASDLFVLIITVPKC
jgi:hypothetical protein